MRVDHLPRPVAWVADLEPAVHGAYHPPKGASHVVLDFSANGNVIGPPPGVAAALAEADLSRYPDPTASELRGAIARGEGLSLDRVGVGNGSTELIWAIARAYLEPGDEAIVVGPTYGEYAVASRAAGARVSQFTLASADVSPSPVPAPSALRTWAKIVWLCHPNNPTGVPFPLERLASWVRDTPGALFVVDEAYLSLADQIPSAISLLATGQVAVLRSMTKDMALAGVRIGAVLAAPAIVDAVRRVIPPWSVSSLAQAAGMAACADSKHLHRARAAVQRSRDHLVHGLNQLGLAPRPGVANFVLVSVGDGCAVTAALLARGCAVRDCASFGFPDSIRIGVRSIADQEVLLAALADVLRDRRPVPAASV